MVIGDLSDAVLVAALRAGAESRNERAAVDLALTVGVLLRADMRIYLVARGNQARVAWKQLSDDLLLLPLSSGEQAALAVASSLAAPGVPVCLADALSRMDSVLRRATQQAMSHVDGGAT